MMDELAAEAKKKQAKTLGRRKVGEDLQRAVLPGPMAKEDKMVAEDKEEEKKAAGKTWGEAAGKAKRKARKRTCRSKEAAGENRKTKGTPSARNNRTTTSTSTNRGDKQG